MILLHVLFNEECAAQTVQFVQPSSGRGPAVFCCYIRQNAVFCYSLLGCANAIFFL
jgi:hypothetical protein